MHLILNLTKLNRGLVLFIPGFMKAAESWNRTDNGKSINIQEQLATKYGTVMVELDITDYLKRPDILVEELSLELMKLGSGKIKILAHSFGAFYAILLGLMHPELIESLILIEPVAKTARYKEYLAKSNDAMQQAKLGYWNYLPDSPILIPKISVKIYLAYPRDDFTEVVEYYSKMVRSNVGSDIIICPGRGHMLHWEIPAKFISL